MIRRSAVIAKSLGFVVLLCALAAMLPWSGGQDEGKPQTGLTRRTITIERQGHKEPLQFDVEIPQTHEQMATGLMFRTDVPEGTGMLFPVNPPKGAMFWMKNTLVSLDMLFIRQDGTIANIAHRTTPRSYALNSSDGPVAYVLEIKGGEAERLGIKSGDKLK